MIQQTKQLRVCKRGTQTVCWRQDTRGVARKIVRTENGRTKQPESRRVMESTGRTNKSLLRNIENAREPPQERVYHLVVRAKARDG